MVILLNSLRNIKITPVTPSNEPKIKLKLTLCLKKIILKNTLKITIVEKLIAVKPLNI